MRTESHSFMKATRLGILLGVLLGLAPVAAMADSTVILSSTVYAGMSQVKSNIITVALPKVGVYVFDMLIESTGTIAFSNLQVYLQQEGLSRGSFYTIAGSTFTACSSECGYALYPDIYLGGRIRAQYNITTGSATVKIIARNVSP